MGEAARPEGFRDHHHRALVLLAANDHGLHVGRRTTDSAISAEHVGYLRRRHLITITYQEGAGRTAYITAEGRKLLTALHDETPA